jgi:hypothetical protein
MVASWLPSTVTAAFGGSLTSFHVARSNIIGTEISFRGNNHRRRRNQSSHPYGYALDYLRAKYNDDSTDIDDGDPLSSDRREGMAGAFAALESLTGDDFDDVLVSPIDSSNSNIITMDINTLMEMQSELSALGEDGLYDNVLGDLTSEELTLDEEDESMMSLVMALDKTVDLPVIDAIAATMVLNDADGIGSAQSTIEKAGATLTTADVSRDILTQEIKPTLSMEDFISSALKEAVNEIEGSPEMLSNSATGSAEDVAQTVGELLENEELRQEIGKIFDVAGTKLRLEVETMKKEQLAAIQSGSDKGLEYLLSEKQRISEADESVSRMIRAVASRTNDVQKAMEELELAKNQASGGKGGSGSIEETALTLKKGGIIKQASLVGGLLFGSRAFTETILVLNSPYGEEHFLPALAQLFIALACAAYFLAGKIE